MVDTPSEGGWKGKNEILDDWFQIGLGSLFKVNPYTYTYRYVQKSVYKLLIIPFS